MLKELHAASSPDIPEYQLFLYAKKGNIDEVRRFLNAGVNPSLHLYNCMDYRDTTIAAAASRGHIDIVKLLVEDHRIFRTLNLESSLIGRAAYSKGAIDAALYNKHYEVVKVLAKTHEKLGMPIISQEVLEYLRQEELDIETVKSKAKTMVLLASNLVHGCQGEITRPSLGGLRGPIRNIFSFLAEHGSPENQMLFQAADTTVRGTSSYTPKDIDALQIANEFFKHYETNPKSRFNSFNINQENLYGSTPLTVAVEKGNLLAAKALLQLGGDPSLENKHGNSAKSLAERRLVKHGLTDMVDLISAEARTTYRARPSL